MKKIIIAVTMALLLLLLAACGNQQNATPDAANSEPTAENILPAVEPAAEGFDAADIDDDPAAVDPDAVDPAADEPSASAAGYAELLPQDSPALVFAYYPGEIVTAAADIDRIELDTSAETTTPEVLFYTKETVTDFTVLDLFLQQIDGNGQPVFLVETRYTQAQLTPERPLGVTLIFTGDIPNRGISFVDPDGVTHYYALSISGKDGSLELTEF